MKLIISSVSGEPIYEQIKNQIRSAIMSGELMAGEGLVENVQGKGTFVMERGNKLMKERARERIMDKLREVSIEAKAADISLLDLLGMFEKAYREQS